MSPFLLLIAMAGAAAPVPSAVLDSYPSPSPDGRSVLFASNRSGSDAIWIADSGGAAPRLLFDGGGLGNEPGIPVWSPDGRRFVFAMRPVNAAREDETDIFVADADGTNVRQLTRTPGDDSHPHWSADGQRIFFNSARGTPDLSQEWGRQWHDIYSMRPDGSDVRRITDCRTVCTYPVLSPDGKWIVQRKTLDGPGYDWGLNTILRNSEVVVTSIDGRTTRKLSNSPAYDGWPVWAANGRWILFVSNRNGAPNIGQLFAIRPDGSGLRQLTSGPLSHVQPMPAADSSRVYASERYEDESVEFGRVVALPLDLGD